MIVRMTLTAYLPFDINALDNELEATIAEIMAKHMMIDYPCGEVYCVVVDRDIEDDLKKAGIDWDTFDKCIAKFEKKGYLTNHGGEYYFAVDDSDEDVELFGYCRIEKMSGKKK